jgi:hypothetical protein
MLQPAAASADVSTTRRIPHLAAAAELATPCRCAGIRGRGNDMVESSAVIRTWRTCVGTAEKTSPMCF